MKRIQQTAVVTGGSSGIGFAIAERLLQEGFRVAFFGSNAGHVEAAKLKLAGGNDSERLFARAVDLRSPDSICTFFDAVEETFGPAGILVNNAGISPKVDGKRPPMHLMPSGQWQDVLTVNLTGAFLCTQRVLPGMMDARFGRVVMIGSIAARALPRFAGAAYVASKAGLAGLTRSLAAEYGEFGITANTVSPGNVASGMTGDPRSPQNQAAARQIPAGRIGQPGDLASIVAFLCLPEAGFINGATVDVTGGEYVAS